MKIRFINILDDTEYEVDEGAVITENKNETLDSAEVSISNLSHTLDLQPLDSCVLLDSRFPDRHMCVSSFDETMLCVNPRIYRYRISLVSETKKLEGVLLPNLSVTPGNGTYDSTVGGSLSRIKELYFEKRRVTDGNSVSWKCAYDFDPDVLSYFNAVPAVEMQWNSPTLREVLTDLMMVRDRIPVLKGGFIYAMDLTKRGSDRTNDSAINYVERSNSVDSYVSSLRMGLENAMQTDKTTRMVEWLPLTSDDYVLTSENCLLRTSYPILKIRSLRMVCHFNRQDIHFNEIWSASQDLCRVKCVDGVIRNLVYEADEYRTLERLVNDAMIGSAINYDTAVGRYQNTSLFYTRGGTEIGGFANQTEYRLGFISLPRQTLTWLADLMFMTSIDRQFLLGGEGFNFQQIFFEVEYETLVSCAFEASKGEYPRNRRTVADNQTNAWVNADAQGFLEYQKANRLGNLISMINARYETFSNMIKIGDSYGDSVVYSCQYQIYKDHIEANAEATKGYVLRDYFTGVKSKIRSWRIVSDSEAFERREIRKFYVEVSTTPYAEAQSSDYYGWAAHFASAVVGRAATPSKTILAAYAAFVSEGLAFTPVFAFDITTRIVGNSVVFTFGAKDNYSVGKGYVIDGNITFDRTPYGSTNTRIGLPQIVNASSGGLGGIPLYDLKYVDTYGRISQAEVKLSWVSRRASLFSEEGKYVYFDVNDYSTQTEWNEAWDEATELIADNCEKAYGAYTVSDFPSEGLEELVKILKDNKETIRFNYQFEFVGNGVKIDRNFVRRQEFVDQSAVVVSVAVDGVVDQNASVAITDQGTNKSYCELSVSLSNATEGKISIRDELGNELISFQGDGRSLYPLYVNLLFDRSKAVYDSQGNIVVWHDGADIE